MKMGILVASTVAAAAVATVASADFAFGNQIAIIGSAWSASGSQTTWGGGYQLGIDAAFDASSGQPWFVGVSSQVVNPNKVVFSIDFSHFDIATNTFYTIDLSGLKSDGSIASVTVSQGFAFISDNGNSIGWDGGGDGVLADPKVFITVEQVPAPASIALLGAAGLIGGRRRRGS